MDLATSDESESRFSAYVEGLVSVIGHADRAGPLRDYCVGLMMPCERKSVEPMAAITAPERKSSASSATRAFRSRCRFRSIRPRRPQKPSRVLLPSGRKLDRSCHSRSRALPRKNCSAAAAPLPLPPPTQPSTAPSRRASRPRRRAVGLTISVGRVARSMSSRARSSRQRLTQRRRMPAPNPPSLPSARRRWMPTLRSRSRPSVGRAHDPNPSPWSNSARTSHSSDSPASSRFPAMPGSLS